MTIFGGYLSGVELDFFSIVSDASKQGFTRKEIDKAYQAAASNAFNQNQRSPGRPKGSRDKDKQIEDLIKKLRAILIANPNKKPFTAANEVLSSIPNRKRLSARHLVKTLREDKKNIVALERLKLLRELSVKLSELRPYADRSPAFSEFLRVWDNDLKRVLTPYFSETELIHALKNPPNE